MKKTYTPYNQANEYDFGFSDMEEHDDIPDDHLIRNIMNYSKALEQLGSGNSEILRIILN